MRLNVFFNARFQLTMLLFALAAPNEKQIQWELHMGNRVEIRVSNNRTELTLSIAT